MPKYTSFQVNQKGVFNPWLVLVLIGILLGWLLFSGKFSSWLKFSDQDSKITTQQPVATVQSTSSPSQNSAPSPSPTPTPTPETAKKDGGLSGLWEGYGYRFNASQNGNSLVLTMVGTNKEIVKGIISGNTFNGTQWLEAKGCPNLEKTVPATGTVSSNIISLKYRSTTYDTSSCVSNGSDTEKDFTAEYTKIQE